LPEAYEADGQLKKALEIQKKALKRAANPSYDISGLEEKLTQLQLLLKK
jgi:hypothetical protein